MKKHWIVISVVLLILVIIGVIWYKNKNLLNKVPDPKPQSTPTGGTKAQQVTQVNPSGFYEDPKMAVQGRG